MTCVTPSNCAEIKDTGTAKGRGVFATRRIFNGETIEVAPVVVIHASWNDIPKEVREIVFYLDYPTGGDGTHCIALGWGSMYNSANPANVRYSANAALLTMTFSAARDIEAGEELTVNYDATDGDIYSLEQLWFEDKGIQPI